MTCWLAIVLATCDAAADGQAPVKGLPETPHHRVQLDGGFWGSRQATHHEVTIPHALDCLEADGHVANFDLAAGKSDDPLRGHHAFHKRTEP